MKSLLLVVLLALPFLLALSNLPSDPMGLFMTDRAAKVIERIYEDAGSAVQVDHGIQVMPPLNRYVEIRFTVSPK